MELLAAIIAAHCCLLVSCISTGADVLMEKESPLVSPALSRLTIHLTVLPHFAIRPILPDHSWG